MTCNPIGMLFGRFQSDKFLVPGQNHAFAAMRHRAAFESLACKVLQVWLRLGIGQGHLG